MTPLPILLPMRRIRPATCEHREFTAHFEWKCTLHANHGGRGHFLAMSRPLEASA